MSEKQDRPIYRTLYKNMIDRLVIINGDQDEEQSAIQRFL